MLWGTYYASPDIRLARALPNGDQKYTTCAYSYSAHRVRITQADSQGKPGIFSRIVGLRLRESGRGRTGAKRHCVVKDRSSLGVIGLECSLNYILDLKIRRKVAFSSSG